MLFIESTSKFSSGLSLLYISFDNLLEFRIVLITILMVTGQCRFNRIGGVIVKVLASSAVDREFKELFDNNISIVY
jgi:hypothetical protein